MEKPGLHLKLPGAGHRRILAIVPVILVLLVGALAYQRARSAVTDVALVERSHEILEASEPLLTRAIDAETGQRAFLLTGNETFLDPYRGARQDIARQIGRLRQLAAGDPARQRRLDVIERLVAARFETLDTTIAMRRRGQIATDTGTATLLLGKRRMDELRNAIDELQNRERAILATRHEVQRRSVRNSSIVVAIGAIAAIVLSGLINLAFSRALSERDAANRELRDANIDLERQSEQLETQAVEMESQAAELEATTEDLRATNDELNRTARAAEEARDIAEGVRSQLESVLENLPDAVSVYDTDWRWTYVNPRARQILDSLGKDGAGIIGKRLWDELPQLKGTRFESETLRAVKDQQVVQYEEYLRDADTWFENSIVPVRDAIMTFSRDITRRKREQEGALLLAEASHVLGTTLDYEKTLEAIARLAVGTLADWCAVALVEETGRIRQVVVAHVDEARAKWAKELNKRYPPDYSAPTGVGQVIRTGEPELYREISDEMIAAAAKDAEHLRIIRELRMKSAIVAPMNARGRTLGALTLVSSDKGRRYDDRDLALAMELATRAAIAMDNAQLYRSALAASEAKSTFLATMSHELRTPLNAIIGYQSLLKEGIHGGLNEAQLAQLGRIRASADHLLALIDEVLTFSRVEAQMETIRREETELKPVIDEAVEMIAPLADEKKLAVRVDADSARVFTDRGKVRQILLNLLSNAVKFTDEGEIVVRSRTSDGALHVEIQDTGIGIAAHNLDRIFDPFWQVEQRATRRVGGTGLGLSVSRRLARLLGGDVRVQSEIDKGSTFTLTLPLRKPA